MVRDHCSEPSSRLVDGGCAWWNTGSIPNLRDDCSVWNRRLSGRANKN
jgi:hypothetical protein